MHIDLTVSIDERLAKGARKAARAMGKCLKQLVRECLEAFAHRGDAEQDIAELRRLSAKGQGRSRGWPFDRDEVRVRP